MTRARGVGARNVDSPRGVDARFEDCAQQTPRCCVEVAVPHKKCLMVDGI
jgi:hypothetical protein